MIPFHEAANLFPLDEGMIDELAADIKVNGQQVPVELFDGKVIDGRRRSTACERLGITPKTVNVSPPDPVAYVLSLNLHRRHLTPSQLSMVAAKVREIYDRQAKVRMLSGKKNPGVTLPQGSDGKSRDLAGKAAGVSGTYVDRATKVIEKGVPELVKAVEEGRMSVTTAAVLASESAEVQRTECASPKRKRTYKPASPKPPAEDQEGKDKAESDSKPATDRKIIGVGITCANEAINCLIRIPKNDALRKRGFQLVTDWINSNK